MSPIPPRTQLPPAPPDLPGWHWELNGQRRRLHHVATGTATRWYAVERLAEAEAEARMRHRRIAATAVAAPGPAPATPWQPGPDAAGVFRRRPGMAERIRVAPRDLVDGRWQPRQAYDETSLAELAASITEHGVIADLVAIVNEHDALELIAGHRRTRAALLAGVADVPVRVVEVTAAQAFALAVVDNDQRADLSDVERGNAYERMIAELGVSEAELARRLSRPRTYIQQRRQIAQAAPELQRALVAGQLNFTQARAIIQGSGGHHGVQRQVTTHARDEAKAGRPESGEALQRRAEVMVRQDAEQTLKGLGWKSQRFWNGNQSLDFFFAPTAKPAAWSSGEILAALREQRRPPAGELPAPLAAADRADLERRGWTVDTTSCAPWVLLIRGKEFLVGAAADVTPQVVEAQRDLQQLRDRFAAAGWAATWNHKTLRAQPPAASSPSRPPAVEVRSWTEAQRLIGQIEKGEWTPESRQSSGYDARVECHRCGTKTHDYEYFDGVGRLCAVCAAPVKAELAELKARMAVHAATTLGDWLDAAPALGAALILRGHFNNMDGQQFKAMLDDPAKRAAGLREAMAAVFWRHRGIFDLSTVPSPATAVAAPPTAPETGADCLPPGSLEHQVAGAGAGVAPYDLAALAELLDHATAANEDLRRRLPAEPR